MLDPHISWIRLSHTYCNEPEQLAELKSHKLELEHYYETYYASKAAPTDSDGDAPGTSRLPMKLDFTSCYMEMDIRDQNELSESFQLVPEHWGKCEPVVWWGARKVQFPNLSCLARDILTIPGIPFISDFPLY